LNKDFRPSINEQQMDKVKDFVVRGVVNYQPFIFSDALQTGAGYEFLGGREFSGLVYWPDIDDHLKELKHLKRFLVKNECREEFFESNARLRTMYESFINGICSYFDNDISALSFADIGCNTGYFPMGFSLRGARQAVGFDRNDFSAVFSVFNDILGTNAEFVHGAYDGRAQDISGSQTYDVVTSVAVICHLSDPLQHLAYLGRIARKALFIWTPVTDDDDYCIRFGEPNKYYTEDTFPYSFDNNTRPSGKLLKKSLELMGFNEIHEFPSAEGGMPDIFYRQHKAVFAVRK